MISTQTRSKWTYIAFAASAALFVAGGCGEGGAGTEGAGTADSGGLPINSPGVVYAKGWTSLDVDANSAKNSVDASGHFHTDHNICQQAGDGVFDVPTWNKLSELLNRAVMTATLPAPRCWDSPSGSKFYNHGIAELVNTNPVNASNTRVVTREPAFASSPTPSPLPSTGPTAQPTHSPSPSPRPSAPAPGIRRTLFEYKNGQICTTIADAELAQAMMEQIETLLMNADRAGAQDCPNYHPPGAN